MKGNKVLQTIVAIIAFVLFEGVFIAIAPRLLGPDIAYQAWGRINMVLFFGGVILTVYLNKKNKK